jgi:hypothetical protein
MHWSTQGLKGILTIAFTRYADKSLCEDFKKACIHNETIQWKGYSTTLTGKCTAPSYYTKCQNESYNLKTTT